MNQRISLQFGGCVLHRTFLRNLGPLRAPAAKLFSVPMSHLLQIAAVRAKWDGYFSSDWNTIRCSLPREDCLQSVPGKNEMQKLKTWAQRQGLLMDFEVQTRGFSTEIHAITFYSRDRISALQAAQRGGPLERPTPAVFDIG